jgi:regulator of sigma E protease
MFSSAGNVLLLAFGFGFVIFWHELGHFLAAKWADVKVEQFAVGFGQALLSYRKGLGVRWGSTQADYQSKLRAEVERAVGQTLQFKEQVDGPTATQLADAGRALGIGETEYRLNWIPLGGYVKMLGQDDLRPGEQVADPRSYTSKPVGKRMVIVSAGVLMNVLLAAIGFMVYFRIGAHVTRPVVGEVVPGSPASRAVRLVPGGQAVPSPILPGDTILKINGRWQADFDKIKLNTPLLPAGVAVPIVVQRAGGGAVETLSVAPVKATPESEFPQLGIAPALSLAPDPDVVIEPAKFDATLKSAELDLIKPGESVVSVDGRDVKPDQYYLLVDALQARAGQPLPIEVAGADGKRRTVQVPPHFEQRFGDAAIDFGGLQMLPQVIEVEPDSPLKGQVLPGDVVVDVADVDVSGSHQAMPTKDELTQFVKDAAKAESKLQLTVRRGDKVLPPLPPVQLDHSHKTLGIAVDYADRDLTVAHPGADTAAGRAGVPTGARLTAVDGRPVANWFDVCNALCKVAPGAPIAVAATVDGKPHAYQLAGLSDAELAKVRSNRLDNYAVAALLPAMFDLKAKSVFEATWWGVGETRDAIVQVKSTIMAMVHGSISPKEVSGPLGILAVGYKFAEAGPSRLLWFLSIISANLAVMNFLPIPVVDGGLFTFLLIEKLKGSPISQRTQSIAQVAGLVLLLSVFLFATYQDVFRLGTLFH